MSPVPGAASVKQLVSRHLPQHPGLCPVLFGKRLSIPIYFRNFDCSTQDARGRVVSAHRLVLASLSSTARRMLEEGRVRPRDVITLR